MFSGIAVEIAAGISWNRSVPVVCVLGLGSQLRSPFGGFPGIAVVLSCLICAGIAAGIALWGSAGIAAVWVCDVAAGISFDRLAGISWNRSIVCWCGVLVWGVGAFVSLFVPSVIRVPMPA